MIGKTRIEALSDALFAIVMTLLILEIKVPVGVSHDELAAELAKDWPSWLSFAITFLLASVFWVDQHRVLHALTEISSASLTLTLVFLALVSILPFSTSLWGHYPQDPLAVSVYFSNQFAVAVALTAQLELAARRGHTLPGEPLSRLRFRLIPLDLMLGSAAAAAFLFDAHYFWVAPVAIFAISRIVRLVHSRRSKPQTVSPA